MKEEFNTESKIETSDVIQTPEVSKKGLTPVKKEIIITVVVLLLTIIVGYFVGKYLFEMLNGPIH